MAFESMQADDILTFSQFWQSIATAIRVEVDSVDQTTRLREDVGLDSLQMLELVLVMDELGAELIEEMVPFVVTVGDLYDHYHTRLSAGRDR